MHNYTHSGNGWLRGKYYGSCTLWRRTARNNYSVPTVIQGEQGQWLRWWEGRLKTNKGVASYCLQAACGTCCLRGAAESERVCVFRSEHTSWYKFKKAYQNSLQNTDKQILGWVLRADCWRAQTSLPPTHTLLESHYYCCQKQDQTDLGCDMTHQVCFHLNKCLQKYLRGHRILLHQADCHTALQLHQVIWPRRKWSHSLLQISFVGFVW